MPKIDLNTYVSAGWSARENAIFAGSWQSIRFRNPEWTMLAFPFELFSVSEAFKDSLVQTLTEISDNQVCFKTSETAPESTLCFLLDGFLDDWSDIIYSDFSHIETVMFGKSKEWGGIFTKGEITLFGASPSVSQRFLSFYGGFNKVVDDFNAFYLEEAPNLVTTHFAHHLRLRGHTFVFDNTF